MGLLDDAIREHLELKRRRGADAGDISRQESDALGPVRRLPNGGVDLPDTFEVEAPAAEPEPEPPRAASTPWEDEPTAAHEPAAPERTYEPPTARAYVPPVSPTPEPRPERTYEPPPARGYEPPTAPSYEPAASQDAAPQEPEPEGWMEEPPQPIAEAKPWLAEPVAPEPTSSMRTPSPSRSAPEPGTPLASEHEPWMDVAAEPDPEPEPDRARAEPEAEHGSLLGRLRIGRRSKDEAPKPPAKPARIDEPDEPDERPAPPDVMPVADEPLAEDVLEETPDFLEETPEHDRLWFEQRPPRDFDFDG